MFETKRVDFMFWAITAIGILFLSFASMPILSPILIVLLGVVFGLLIIATFASEDFNFLVNIFLIGVTLRIFLSYLFYSTSFLVKSVYLSPGFLFVNDGFCYSQQGWQICQFAERGIKVTAETFMNDPNMRVWGSSGNITFYDFFASHVYSITGYSPLSLFFISSIAGSISGLFIYLIAKELFSKNVARISAGFAFFWPSFIMWSTQNLKEPMVAMFTFIFLWAIFYMSKHLHAVFIFLCLACLWTLFMISFPLFIIIVFAICLSVLFLFTSHFLQNKGVAIIVIGILGVLAFIFLKDSAISFIAKKSNYDISSYNSILDFFQYHRSVRAHGSLQFLKEINISNPVKAIFYAPLGLLYAIFAPFPWQLGSVMQIMAVPETIVFYALFPCTVKGVIFAYKKRFAQSILILSIILAMLSFLALVEGNSGTLFRHRAIVFYLILMFTAAGMTLKNEN